MKRQFFTRHPETNKPIQISQGESGYRHVTPSDSLTHKQDADTAMDMLNAFYNNTPRVLEIAVACSMFGWDIPLAGQLSKKSSEVNR